MTPNALAKVGPISHVSCIDLQSPPGGDLRAPYAQLESFGLARLESLCALLGARPARVMARCAADVSQVFLGLTNGVQIQYFGSVAAGRREQRLWVEGPGGSLLQEGALLWWRKRGWPKFLPWGLRLESTAKGAGEADETLFAAIRRAHEQGQVVSLVA